MRGIPTQLDGSTEYIAVAPDTATADSSLILADDMTISADAEPQAVTRIVLPISPAEGQILTLKDELSPAGTYPIEIIGSMDGVGEKDIVITGGTLQIVFSGGEWRLI